MDELERDESRDDEVAETASDDAGESYADRAADTPRPLPSSAGAVAKPDQNDLLLVLAAHLGGLVGFTIIAPLVVYLVVKDTKPFVRSHALEALNFQISVVAVSVPLAIISAFICITIPLVIAIGVAAMVFSIIASLKAAEGLEYRYPVSFRFVT